MVSQPSAMPTNKLSASLGGAVIGALAYAQVEIHWPGISEIHIEGIGSMSLVFQLIGGAVLGYIVKDRPNVDPIAQ